MTEIQRDTQRERKHNRTTKAQKQEKNESIKRTKYLFLDWENS